MSWSKGNKRWTIPFMSHDGISCRVDIYQRGYTGSTVTELSSNNANTPGLAAADPFYFEEDDDQNLLSVVRTKSGYINLVETVQDGLYELHPSTNVDHYVEFYYGTLLYFNGFIQAQDFDEDWTSVPREVSLPVTSILGVLKGYNFTYKNQPSQVTLKSLVQEILQNADSLYDYCVFPDLGGFSTVGGIFNCTVNSLVVSPFSDRWYNTNNLNEVYDPITYLSFIEGMCNCFGLMVHDTPRGLEFAKFDHSGSYFRMNSNGTCFNIGNIGGTAYDLDANSEVRGADNTITNILPLNKITTTFEGDVIESADMNFDQCRKTAGSSLLDGWHLANIYPMVGDFSADYLITSSFILMSDGYFGINGSTRLTGTYLVAAGEESLTEQIICQASNSWDTSKNLFKWTCFNPPRGAFIFSFEGMLGNGIHNLSETPTGLNPNINIYLSCGDKKWDNVNKVWGDTSRQIQTKVGGKHEYFIGDPGIAAPIEITFYIESYWSAADILSFRNLSLSYGTSLVGEYIGLVPKNYDKVLYGTPSPEEGEIEALFHRESPTDHRLNNATGGYIPYIDYPYLIQSQTRLNVATKITDNTLTSSIYHHCRLYKFWKTNWRWRLIALSFHPWDDEWTLTMHRSSTIG